MRFSTTGFFLECPNRAVTGAWGKMIHGKKTGSKKSLDTVPSSLKDLIKIKMYLRGSNMANREGDLKCSPNAWATLVISRRSVWPPQLSPRPRGCTKKGLCHEINIFWRPKNYTSTFCLWADGFYFLGLLCCKKKSDGLTCFNEKIY